jgi:hypothetical protein
MALQIGDTAPDFEAETTHGRIRFHDWIGDSWAVLFSHPRTSPSVCSCNIVLPVGRSTVPASGRMGARVGAAEDPEHVSPSPGVPLGKGLA